MLLADTKPIWFEKERADLRAMLERLNLGMGELSNPSTTDTNHSTLIDDSKSLR